MRSRDGRICFFGALIIGAIILAGCGSGGSDSTASSDASTQAASTKGSSSEFLAANAKELEADYKGTFEAPDNTSPTPAKGKSVWVLSCGQVAEGCAIPAAAAEEAGEAVGWNMKLVDGNLNPSTYGSLISQAAAAQADAVLLDAIDCPLVQGPLKQARAAGVKVVAWGSIDCDDPRIGGEALFDREVTFGDGSEGEPKHSEEMGEAKARWLISATEGEAKIIDIVQPEILLFKFMDESFRKALEPCTTCEIVDTVEVTNADYGPELQSKTQEALLRNPDANALVVPYDALLGLGVEPALKASGREDELEVTALQGFPDTIKMMREGVVDAVFGEASEWQGWAAVDALNRLFDGSPAVSSGIGHQTVDKEHNMPKSGGFEPPIDFKSAYEAAWGLK
ncbi:MAG: sugar ABC transporter substrate-binding protein [Solirubrobacterales bacterium]